MVSKIKLCANLVDSRLIQGIAERASVLDLPNFDWTSTCMDLTACHLNGCPLDLERLAKARDIDLLHDVLGIARHLDRNTGKLKNCFLPRFAAKTQTSGR